MVLFAPLDWPSSALPNSQIRETKHIELGLHFFSLITVSDPKTVEFYLQVFEVV